jgi:hypothetical protein
MHLAITQDEVGQDGEHRTTRRALKAPDSDSTQANTDIMGMAGEAPATAADGLMFQLKTQGQHKGHNTFQKPLTVAKQLKVGRFVSKIDGDGAVFARRFGRCAHVSPLCHQVSQVDEIRWGEHIEISRLS